MLLLVQLTMLMLAVVAWRGMLLLAAAVMWLVLLLLVLVG
jgi:hypothetical protein